MEALSRTWLAFARSCMAMVSLPRSWQDLGKANKELAMDLGKDTMASNIECFVVELNCVEFHSHGDNLKKYTKGMKESKTGKDF